MMNANRELLDEIFVSKLGYEFQGISFPFPNIDGQENLISLSKEYSANGVDVIFAECSDRILEFQKKLIQHYKNQFPDSHFLFVSNQGSVFDLYNVSSSKKLKKITYNEIDQNTRLFKEKIQLFDVEQSDGTVDLKIKIDKAFDTSDKITKKFYDKFEAIHKKLTKAIFGINDEEDRAWYASVLMNRIMFIYFLQKHRFIQDDYEFLLTKYDQAEGKGKNYYRDFLLPLFFYGFAKRDSNSLKQKFIKEYGYVKYLNGGLFYPHGIEKKYTPSPASKKEKKAYDDPEWIIDNIKIEVDGKALKSILQFLNGKTWYLDSRPLRDENDINPDVLGYIFEKYINQKELGAYYTKPDITGYISKNTIIPFILDKLRRNGFEAPDPNPMITNNENIIGKMADYLEQLHDYNALKFLYKDVLAPLSVLDPAVGSGAFLFAALNILLPIYRKVVFKLKTFREQKNGDEWLQNLCTTLDKHSEEYFLTKQIILNNLYGVDIVEEATEICKLRLFLQLASHLPNIQAIEPLPDIDFNIYAGNSLVGGLSWEDLEGNYTMDLFTSANRENIKRDVNKLSKLKTEYKQRISGQIQQLNELKEQYRLAQQEEATEEELNHLKSQIEFLEKEINANINIGIDNPFHWFIEFNQIMEKGGFDVIIGNPPYVEYSKIRKDYQVHGYYTERSGNLYAFLIERSHRIACLNNYTSFIVPVSIICTDRMLYVQSYLLKNYNNLWVSSFAERPSKLFEDAERNVSVLVYNSRANQKESKIYSTEYIKWYSSERSVLFDNLSYNDISGLNKESIIPKLGSPIENNIWKKIESCKAKVENYLSPHRSKYKIVYRNSGGRYWKIVTDFTSYFTIDGQQQISSRETYLHAANEMYQDCLIAILNSTSYYWWYIQNSDTRTNNPSHLKKFPVDLDRLDLERLKQLKKELMQDYINKSAVRTKNQKTGYTEYAEFYPRLSKHIIDEIDELLGYSYQLNQDEMNFIKKYAIEFRMGDEE